MFDKIKQFIKTINNQEAKTPGDIDHFAQAKSWSDDLQTSLQLSCTRYQRAFVLMVACASVLAAGLTLVALKQTTALVVVHEGESGYHWVSLEKANTKLSITWAETEADIAHYVMTRESYDPLMYRYQAHEVSLLSSPLVKKAYEDKQSQDHSSEAVSVLSSKGYRIAEVNSILPLDHESNDPHQHQLNVAKVDFTVTDHFFNDAITTTHAYTVLISWQYNGVPSDPDLLLHDWNGFEVTRYLKELVTVSQLTR